MSIHFFVTCNGMYTMYVQRYNVHIVVQWNVYKDEVEYLETAAYTTCSCRAFSKRREVYVYKILTHKACVQIIKY